MTFGGDFAPETDRNYGGTNKELLPNLLRSGLGQSPGIPGPAQADARCKILDLLPQLPRRSVPIESFVARDRADLHAARGLLKKRYARCRYLVPDEDIDFPDAARAQHYFTIVAKANGAVTGSVILGLDSAGGLLVDEENKHEVDAIRAKGGRVCELVKLALEDAVAAKDVLASLFECVYTLCWAMYDVTHVLIEVTPRHVGFYRRVLGFVQAAEVKTCKRVGGVPIVLLELDRCQLEQRLWGLAQAA